MIAVRPKRFPVWLRFGNGPKLRSLCQEGGAVFASQNRTQTAAKRMMPVVNKRNWSRASRNSSCCAQTTYNQLKPATKLPRHVSVIQGCGLNVVGSEIPKSFR